MKARLSRFFGTGKYAYLLKNIGLLTLGSFTTKLLSFFLLPVYTYKLSTSEYGIYDLINTSIMLLFPILTINIQEGILRYSIGNKNSKEIIKYGIRFVNISEIIILMMLALNSIFILIPSFREYWMYFALMYYFSSLNQVLLNYARGCEKITQFTFASIISALTTIMLNILLLVIFDCKIEGFFFAYIIGYLVSCIYLLIRLNIYSNPFSGRINQKLKKEIIRYSAPTSINMVAWWINSTSDRYFVTGMCGIAENGIYSVGYKIPSMLNVLQSIFNQAWILSAVKEYDKDDSKGFFKNIYSVYNFILVILCAFIIAFTKKLAFLLYAKEFYTAWKYVPFLTISVVFGALSGVLVGPFVAVKDTKVFSITTIIGAIVNLLLDCILVYKYGPFGATIATLVSYITVWIVRLMLVRRYIMVNVSIIRDIFSYLLLIFQAIIIFFIDSRVFSVICAIIIVLILGLYQKEFSRLYDEIKMKRGNVQ